jgi:hypothetical protein
MNNIQRNISEKKYIYIGENEMKPIEYNPCIDNSKIKRDIFMALFKEETSFKQIPNAITILENTLHNLLAL